MSPPGPSASKSPENQRSPRRKAVMRDPEGDLADLKSSGKGGHSQRNHSGKGNSSRSHAKGVASSSEARGRRRKENGKDSEAVHSVEREEEGDGDYEEQQNDDDYEWDEDESENRELGPDEISIRALLRKLQKVDGQIAQHQAEREELLSYLPLNQYNPSSVASNSASENRYTFNKLLSDRDAEITRLEEIILGLKHSISTSTRMEAALSDDIVRERWSKVGWELMNCCISGGAAGRGKMSPEELPSEIKEILQKTTPLYEYLWNSGQKVFVLQGLISKLITDTIYIEPWFYGLDSKTSEVLQDLGCKFSETSSETSTNGWRSSTMLLLRSHLQNTVGISSLAVSETERLIAQISPLFPSTTGTSQRQKMILAVVSQIISITHDLRAQRAKFELFIPKATGPLEEPGAEDLGDEFDPERMEDLTGEDESELRGKRVACVAFPGIWKWGDEMGENLDIGNCVCKARVICALD